MLLYGWLKKAVDAKGSAKALIYRDTYLSWRGLLHRVDRRADELVSAGIRPGDFVGLMLGNVPDFIILSLALSKVKAVPVPLDPTTNTRDLDALMSIVALRGLVTRPRGSDAPLQPTQAEAGATKPSAKKKFTPESRKRLQGTLLTCSIYGAAPRTLAKKESDRIAAVLVTSDGTGEPKPVERTATNLTADAAHLAAAADLTGDDRALLTVPMFYSFGFHVGFVSVLSVGGTIYLEDEVAANKVVKLVRDQNISFLPGTLTLFNEMSRLPSARPFSHEPLRFISLGGGLVGPALDGFKEKYGLRPWACFHTTETGLISLDVKGQAGSTVGKVAQDVEIQVRDPKTQKPVASGKPGSLWIKSDAISPLELWSHHVGKKDDAVTAIGTSDDKGWYRTGDIVTVDRSAKITLTGREDDLVRLDGKRVSLGEIENCIATYPKVVKVQVAVIVDPVAGPMLAVKVAMKDKAVINAEAIIDHCAKHLAPYKVPRRVQFAK